MPGLLGGGGSSGQQAYVPYNAGGSGQGGTVYTPAAQPAFDQNYQSLVGTLQNLAFNNQGNGPWEFAPYAGQNALNVTPQFNPYAAEQVSGAVSQGGYLAGLGQGAEATAGQYAGIPGNIYGLAGQAGAGVGPTQQLASGVAALAPGVTTGIAPLQQGAAQILQTGYDPQSALFNRLRQQSLDASNATNSMAGLGSSPYGAENTAEALNNFGIDWQNQQLAREAQALGAAGRGYGQAGALAGTAGGLLEGAGGLYGSAAGQAGQAASLYGGVVPAAGQNLALGGAGANTAMTGYGLPYSTSVAQSQAAIPALQAAGNIGLQQALLPQQVLNDIQSYLRLGQSASTISGELGNTGFNQGQAQLGNIGASLSGLGSILGGATGSNLTGLGGLGSAIGSGISGLGGLFGGGTAVPALASGAAAPYLAGGGGLEDAFAALGTAVPFL